MKFRKILSVALSAALVASSASLSVFAEETDKKYDYVALGDSIAAGFGLENSDGTILTDRAVCVTPELLANPIKGAYAAVFGTYLEEMGQANGYTTTATNLSAVGYRANDVAETIMRDGFVGQTAVGILEGFLGKGGSAPLWQYHKLFNEYLSEAELVSIQLGGNDIILELFGDMGSQDNTILSTLSTTLLLVLAGFDSNAAIQYGINVLRPLISSKLSIITGLSGTRSASDRKEALISSNSSFPIGLSGRPTAQSTQAEAPTHLMWRPAMVPITGVISSTGIGS